MAGGIFIPILEKNHGVKSRNVLTKNKKRYLDAWAYIEQDIYFEFDKYIPVLVLKMTCRNAEIH